MSQSHLQTHVLVAISALACTAIASIIAWPNFAGSAGAPAYVTKADFDQTFADVAIGRHGSKPTIRDEVDGSARSSGGATTNVNRDRKSDRLPVLGGIDAAAPASTSNTTVVRKNAASPGFAKGANGTPARPQHCEPVASPVADPVLGRIIGRCFV